MKKQMISALCAIMMTMGLLSACGDSRDNKAKKADSSGSDKTTESVDISSDDETIIDVETTDSSEMTPAMWRVEGDNGAVITLAGSMHALNESDYPLPEEMMNAFESSEILAVEADLSKGDDINFQSSLLASMYYDDPTETLHDHISQEAYDELDRYMGEYSISLSQYDNMMPWAVSNIADNLPLQFSGLSADMGIDRYLTEKAKDSGKEVYEVEGQEFQIDLLMNFSDDIYEMMFLTCKNKTKQNQVQLLIDTHNAWRKGDMDALEELSDDTAEIPDDYKATLDEYYDLFLYNRNRVMADSAEEFIKGDKNVFFMVGAAHYGGDKGIIALLEKDGYNVERIEY
ncbi:TraB/GumN family protein [Ruminococcus sp.]|uniref:TraB/GumN family protein n=1 Tax=Ruminococcus sp. TaxID=41978 RepID=UPI0025DC1DD4|nr:TraB/GumN family protein [Ruminococcus sp.]MBQ8965423.1 TraB/GumN family protein [Ruminococcus sp.]